MKKQDIEKLVSELRESAESCLHYLNAYKFDEAADALERILKEGVE